MKYPKKVYSELHQSWYVINSTNTKYYCAKYERFVAIDKILPEHKAPNHIIGWQSLLNALWYEEIEDICS